MCQKVNNCIRIYPHLFHVFQWHLEAQESEKQMAVPSLGLGTPSQLWLSWASDCDFPGLGGVPVLFYGSTPIWLQLEVSLVKLVLSCDEQMRDLNNITYTYIYIYTHILLYYIILIIFIMLYVCVFVGMFVHV